MAEVFPSFENIDRLKVKPTEGEIFLVNWLVEHLSDEFEVYFQPFLNGDMPDIIIMKRESGVIIIEVKDWNLSSYSVNYKNDWTVINEQKSIKSPFQQAFGYKNNMFQLHINGIAELNVLDKKFYNIIKPYVYFHSTSKNEKNILYFKAEKELKEIIFQNNEKFKNKVINFDQYEKTRLFLSRKSIQIRRDKGTALIKDNIQSKLLNELKNRNILFTDDIYYEFRRYLRPPTHIAEEGKDINYGKKQLRLSTSKPSTFLKIKGVAGSGKTTVLAKRAVNAHKRHGGNVLILTYNKTLRNYIRDKISEVRENFTWGAFGILNYHSFINQNLNKCGIKAFPKENSSPKEVSAYLDHLYSDINLFSGYEDNINTFSTILIDEIQDYKPEWIDIIKKYFITDDGEMILFGDESQNIYHRDTDDHKATIIRGFGSWERLTKSYRAKEESQLVVTIKNFQEKYLISKYDIDMIELKRGPQPSLPHVDLLHAEVVSSNMVECVEHIYDCIFKILLKHEIHPNDVTIISTNIDLLRLLDKIIRDKRNEETMRTFETEEVYLKLLSDIKNINLEKELDILRGSKKFSFENNSGHLKLSTVHSFKGIESSFIVYLLTEKDAEELIYTAITRSKKDLMIFLPDSSAYFTFFKNQLGFSF